MFKFINKDKMKGYLKDKNKDYQKEEEDKYQQIFKLIEIKLFMIKIILIAQIYKRLMIYYSLQ